MNRKLLGVLRLLPMLWLPASCVVDDGSAGPSPDSPDTTSDVAALTDDSEPSSDFQETHPPTCGTQGTPPCPG